MTFWTWKTLCKSSHATAVFMYYSFSAYLPCARNTLWDFCKCWLEIKADVVQSHFIDQAMRSQLYNQPYCLHSGTVLLSQWHWPFMWLPGYGSGASLQSSASSKSADSYGRIEGHSLWLNCCVIKLLVSPEDWSRQAACTPSDRCLPGFVLDFQETWVSRRTKFLGLDFLASFFTHAFIFFRNHATK